MGLVDELPAVRAGGPPPDGLVLVRLPVPLEPEPVVPGGIPLQQALGEGLVALPDRVAVVSVPHLQRAAEVHHADILEADRQALRLVAPRGLVQQAPLRSAPRGLLDRVVRPVELVVIGHAYVRPIGREQPAEVILLGPVAGYALRVDHRGHLVEDLAVPPGARREHHHPCVDATALAPLVDLRIRVVDAARGEEIAAVDPGAVVVAVQSPV
mmetsp:Transcript_78443/g.204546  ORF Transcript_78443/g.204546 Transcript_78443/m.204546 type:complete len:212 (+) Transcript_78443:619-1254(+)